MNNRKALYFVEASVLLLVFVLLFSACQSTPPVPGTGDQSAVQTQTAQEVSLQLTQQAGEAAVIRLTEIASQVETQPAPVYTATPTAVLPTQTAVPVQPTATQPPATATHVLAPTNTPMPPTPTAKPLPCNLATLVRDVTVTDGTIFTQDEAFTKTWQLKNVGSCTWTEDYNLVYSSGSQMDGSNKVRLNQKVRPGETVNVSVALVAPSKDGKYAGYWMLRDTSGNQFGVGSDGKTALWVSIKVDEPDKMVYSFVSEYCDDAGWKSAGNVLACPDQVLAPAAGYVTVQDKPKIETGNTENEKALVVHPADRSDVSVAGWYQSIKIENGDHFMAVVGCMYDTKDCSVTFELSIRPAGHGLRTVETWKQTYDGKIQKIDVNLSEFADQNVEIVLIVNNDGSSAGDTAFWLNPRIMR